MLTAHGLSCQRGERRLFAGLDLSVGAGEWLYIKGENGSGKTTLLRTLVGLAHPAEGEVRWRNQALRAAADDYRRELLYLGHHGAMKEDLTPFENLRLSSALDGNELPERDTLAALHRLGLRGREDLPVRFLSAGQKRRVLLARLVTRKATLWILDEPFTALDVKAVDMLSGLIGEHLAAGGMAVLTSHQALPLPAGQTVDLSSPRFAAGGEGR